ncbi:hypothetical protein [Desulfosporosinus sp. OT]|uniref:hypothetical protein n=1 Tax=Desulfosporosinus sp. OT TaxID=913865 RepID=UPI000223A4B7|nr:hypothetical protein [Desulfosporosinus sp. OT]EGW37876.1 hypothetical protein DOT_4284 [Desulfosporosinus sp. OT]
MDQETREMFGKVLGILETMKTDVAGLKTDVAGLKTDVAGLKTDVAGLKTDVAELKTDVAELKTDSTSLKTEMKLLKQAMVAFGARQDEMYLMLKSREESHLRMKALEEKSSVSVIERDQLKMESAKIVGALRRGAHEILKGLGDEEVS